MVTPRANSEPAKQGVQLTACALRAPKSFRPRSSATITIMLGFTALAAKTDPRAARAI